MPENKSDEKFVTIVHANVDGEGRVSERSYAKVWSNLGWTVKSDEDTRGTTDGGLGRESEPTQEELYEQAQELGIEGRSSMNKDELVKALKKARK